MKIQNVGVIFELEKDNFIHKGFGYIKNKMKLTTENNISFGFNPVFSFNNAFQNKIEELSKQFQKENQYETIKKENQEVNFDIFEKYKGYLLDIIIFPNNSFKGIDAINIANSSIVYFQLYSNISIGFLVQKELAYILFKKVGDSE
ncbi:hypothetical protein C4N15_07540 [Fusobacterium necrophorum subsp. funduliforme]|uniref:hypothetical protein n=1 Tax=Fusobacterium necrophorum TaxID=859 RepID=UPI000245D968|nr:hypothetical protein [Fusobacterium necrophorum]AVQ21510.1 hypothetical protein C4N15_07540 [Fusobacterium necrophorum subsp. funduliforme]EHO19548.1 hypothetical protein HMPREF9466_01479 [Fusobacterium necrophorum subsp. funduliforme 1_1_36S]